MTESNLDILARTSELGDQGDIPGYANPVSMDEINDIIHAASDPVVVRVEKLQKLRQEFVSRASADFQTDYGDYIAEIDRGLDELQGPADGFIVTGALDEFDDPAGLPTETSAMDDPDPAATRLASGSVSSPIDLDADSTPDGEPTTNPASRIG